ncbi:MAG: YihY/virulence factor BrkB family protein [Kiritimatiellae bacterium]|nr:YihY/virulence factor BrkB family protein [Kiritimatiellia bacterium]
MIEEARSLWKRLTTFLFHDIWEARFTSVSGLRGVLARILRVGHLVIRGFREDDLTVHASALTFATLMSLVPLLAIAFSLLKGLGVGDQEINRLMEWKDRMPVEFERFIDQTLAVVSGTSFAALGWVGLVVLLFAAILVLGSAEISFNRIWGITRSRNMLRRVANYISILVVVPILIGVAGTITAFLRSEAIISRLGSVGFLYRSLLRLTPLFSTWLAFGFLYVFLPNTRVRAMPALVSGLVGALLWLGWQKLYIGLQVGVARYNAIYGTFASVPIFLAWLYTSWVIVLLGAEVAFAIQNEATYHLEQAGERAGVRAKAMIGLAVVLRAAEALSDGRSSFELGSFSQERRVPIRLLNELVALLVRAGWLAEVAERSGRYVLLRAPDKVRVRDVFDVVMRDGASPEQLGLVHLGESVEGVMGAVDQTLDSAFGGQTIQDLLKDRGLRTTDHGT